MAVTQAMIDNTKRFEGAISFMYLDTGSNVTAGVGFLLPDEDAGADLGFVVRADDSAASAAQVAADWNSVHDQAPNHNHPASFYEQFTLLDLPDTAIDTGLRARLESFEGDLQDLYADYDTFPAAAQEGLMDMIFNLGKTKLANGYPHFNAAVNAKDWATAATECHRNGIGDERNDFVRDLFVSAGP